KVTVLTLTGAAPSVTRELYFEGSYLSSRRIDQTVRAVLTGGAHGPTLLTYPEQPVVKAMITPDGTVWTSSPGVGRVRERLGASAGREQQAHRRDDVHGLGAARLHEGRFDGDG